MPRDRWSPEHDDTAWEFHERAMRYLIQDFETDRATADPKDHADLFARYLERAVQLGHDFAEDLMIEADWLAGLPPKPPTKS